MAKRYKNRWIGAFLKFLSLVEIPSKEMAVPGPITPYGAQLMFLDHLDEGLSSGQHFFVCLKARQLGISTILLALDIFWLYMHPGLQGALIADTHENRETFRATITQMLDSLPHGFRIPIKAHNRNALILGNGSRLQYLSAGKGKNNGLGRSKGLNFVHASEISSWGDQLGIDSLKAALAEENPNRLYMFESTALGYNVFFDMYREALADPMQRAFFIGWWAKEIYRIREDHPEFQRLWLSNPTLNEWEKEIEAMVLEDYGVQIEPEQWAWWRKIAGTRSEVSLLQEYPHHANVAFQVTGSPFFNLKRVNEDMEFCRSRGVSFDGYRYTLGDTFLTMKCDQVMSGAEADLRIWEAPVKNARYAIGVDVAYGRSDTNDRHVIQVFRCYADKAVQVAEWATSIPETRHVAWVLAHLAGSYRDCMINLEVSGPGQQVMDEIKFLRQQIQHAHLRDLTSTFNARDALSQARWYLYHRPDSPGGGYLYNWKTNFDNKSQMFNGFRDSYNTEQVLIRSVPLLEEMITLVQNGASIQAGGRNKDDRPFSAGLAIHAWSSWIRPMMIAENRTYQLEMAKQQQIEDHGGNVVRGIIPSFFQQAQRERTQAELRDLLEGRDEMYRPGPIIH